jgi:hypothetical protein
MPANIGWSNHVELSSRKYICGYCGASLASNTGYRGQNPPGRPAFIYICHHCSGPTFFDVDGRQFPGAAYGETVADVPDAALVGLYDEARRSTSASAYTAAVLCCRKILMHIAVSKGAKAGESFVAYAQYLADNNYVPPDAKEWVDHIRQKGNEANHEILVMSKGDAEELLSFIEMLLKVIYEFPAAVRKKYSAKSP